MSDPANTTKEVMENDTRIRDEAEKDTLIELEPDMGGDRDRLHGMPKEYSGWDVYDNEAKKVDTELVNDWTASLNSLLLFAAIFAAVLTAFIVESKRLLELDPSDAMLDVMIFVANNLANGNHTAYARPKFEPEQYSVTVNCLLFASLSTSLVAALASVVALQWVAEYDAAITRGGSSPEDRAKRRQFRYAGVLWWKMSEIIATLPLLLYCSVVLFFSGLVLWMRIIHQTVGAVVAGGMGMAVLFYGLTTILSVISVSAPFRTPLSRLIYLSGYLFLSTIYSLIHLLPIPSIQTGLKERRGQHTGGVRRDNDEVDKRSWLGMEALVWLANHLSISLDSYDRLLLLANELRKQDASQFESPGFKEAPWFSIFDLLGWRIFNIGGQEDDIGKEEMRTVAILTHCYRIPTVYEIIRPKDSMSYCSDEKQEEYWSQSCDLKRAQWSPSTTPNSLFLFLRDILLPSKDTARELEFTSRLSHWRNSLKQVPEQWEGERFPQTLPSVAEFNPLNGHRNAGLSTSLIAQDTSLFIATAGQIIRRCVKNGERVPPLFLDAILRRLECIFLEHNFHNMDAECFLSKPRLYYESYRERPEMRSLHGDSTLLLARNIKTFTGVERARRVKEVITMMRVRTGDHSKWYTLEETQGMESFFEENTRMIMGCFRHLRLIPHIHEILEHLALAQTENPEIGSLWRQRTFIMDFHDLTDFLHALQGVDELMICGVSEAQHAKLIDLVCRDIELTPPGSIRRDFDSKEPLNIGHSSRLHVSAPHFSDPCLAFVADFVRGSEEIGFVGDFMLHKQSWMRIAKHIINHYEGTDSSNILRLQASAWPLVPQCTRDLCERACSNPPTLAWLQRLFQYPVKCHDDGHDVNKVHLLIHVLENHDGWSLPVNLPGLDDFSMKNSPVYAPLTAVMWSDEYDDLLRKEMHIQEIDERCIDQLLEIFGELKLSQYSLLALSLSRTRSVNPWPINFWPHHVAFSVCINKGLNLPDEQRTTSLIRPLIGALQIRLLRQMGYEVRDVIAMRETANTIKWLNTHLARLRFSSRANSRVLACARATGEVIPGVGWLPPHIG